MARAPLRRLCLCCIAAILLITLSAPLALAAQPGPVVSFTPAADAAGEDSLQLVLPALRWETVPGGVTPKMDGFGQLGLVASPDLPLRVERVALPAGGGLEILDVRVEWAEGRIPGLLAAFPAADPRRDDLGAEFLEDIGYWPQESVRLRSTHGAFRGLHFASLEIRPLQVDLARGRFRVARRIEILLRRTGAGYTPQSKSGAVPGPLESRLDDRIAYGPEIGGGAFEKRLASAPEIDANPLTYPAWDFEVKREGLTRISYSWAQAENPELLSFLTANDPRQYRIIAQGVEIPILVDGEDDGIFDPPSAGRPSGDSIAFYGQPITTDILDPDVWQSGDFTDINVYRLDIAPAPRRMEDQSAAPVSGYQVPNTFPETVLYDPPLRFLGFVPENGVDHWYFYPWLNTDQSVQEVDLFLDTPGHSGGDVSLRARLLGFDYTNNLHRTEVLVDDVLVDGCGDGDGGCVDWDGHIEFTHGEDQGPVVFNTTLGPTTKVSVGIPLGRGVSKDTVGVNWIELNYDRNYDAVADELRFSADNGPRELRVGGLSAEPVILELSDVVTSDAGMGISIPRRIIQAEFSGGQSRFQIEDDAALPATRRFDACTLAAMAAPSRAHEDLPPSSVDSAFGDSLKGSGLGADWLVIAHRSLLFDEGSTSLGPELSALISHRSDPLGQNLQTAVVDVQDVYDEFSFGIPEPQAIRDFLAYVLGGSATGCAPNWDPAPSFVVLLGDGTWDHKNNYGYAIDRQFVPVQMFDIAANTRFGFYPSDTWFAAVCGDDLIPDLSIGRIPAHSFAEAEGVLRKIRLYETADYAGSIAGKALLISEYEGPTSEFFRVHDEIYDKWFTNQPQTAQKLYEAGDGESDADDLNNALDSAVNTGAAMASYVGHGGYKDWGNGWDIFKTEIPGSTDKDDQEDWLAGTPSLFTVHANCITGNFAATSSQTSSNDTWYSFLEDTLLTPEKSMVAGLAPSHLTATYELDQILDPVYEEIFSRRKERLVGAIEMRLRTVFDDLSNEVSQRSFMLQGDPATLLTIPAPATPTITGITREGSGELRIAFSAPSDPEISVFRIYRSRSSHGSYQLAGQTADASTFSYLDSGLTNCTEYYYYVVSVDQDGFESRWSNFNETCGGTGEDCWFESPENPDPPSTPTLLSVTDNEKGGQLEVSWQKVADEDITHYLVVYGTQPGNYTKERIVFADVDSTVLSSLENGTRYYIAVRSRHCSQDSPDSNELDAVPHLVKGINPPESVGDLRVTRVADDLRLDWSIPQESVWGTGTNVTSIEVYGSSSVPDFPVDPEHRLVTLPGDATSWTHAGQGTPAAQRWYYLVVAVDGETGPSAAGVELPAAVADLRVLASDVSTLVFSWSAISSSMAGQRMHISGYNLYGRDSVLPRVQTSLSNLLVGDIPNTEPQPGSSQRSVTIPVPAEPFVSYQLLAEETHGNESVW